MRVKLSSRLAAAAAYPALMFGAALIAKFRADDPFARSHAKTAAGLTVIPVLALGLWFAAAELLSLLPYAGFPTAIALASIAAALSLYCCLLLVLGCARALMGRPASAPLVDAWFDRLIILLKRLVPQRGKRGSN